MTDESVLIGLVKLQLRKVKLGCLNLTEISDEEIMISNLPLLFADGYPTCLEKITLVSIYLLAVHGAFCCLLVLNMFQGKQCFYHLD
jgi:hypothetical protein